MQRRRAEWRINRHFRARRFGHALREGDRRPFGHDINIQILPAQDNIPDNTPDNIRAQSLPVSGAPDIADNLKDAFVDTAQIILHHHLSARMKLFMDRLQALFIHVCINLRRGNVRMAQHLLHRTQVRPVLQQMRGERMTQGMRFDHFLDIGLARVMLDDLPRALAAHLFPQPAQEQVRGHVALV